MKILIIADLHDINLGNIKKIKEYDFDICFMLGDINKKGIDIILNYIEKEKIYGITGNHEDFQLLNRCGIKDLDNKVIDINGIKVVGLSGSVKYKSGMWAMRTQEECSSIVNNLNIDFCDILISHETGYHYINTDKAHEGFHGISNFINKYNPKYNLFGHYHKNLDFLKGTTRCICTYQCNILNYETGKIKNIIMPNS